MFPSLAITQHMAVSPVLTPCVFQVLRSFSAHTLKPTIPFLHKTLVLKKKWNDPNFAIKKLNSRK